MNAILPSHAELMARHTPADGPYSSRYLSVLQYAPSFTLWHYRAPATPLAKVLASGFFDRSDDLMKPGDMVMISAADGGAQAFVVQSGDEVVLAPMLATQVAS